MESIKLLVLAITQGLSELLPVSSSAHLIILGKIINIQTSILLLTSLQIGTTIAIIAFFWRKLVKNIFTKKKLLFYVKIIASVIPSAILGILFEKKIEGVLQAEWIIASSLIFWGIIMVITQRKVDPSDAVDDIENITWQQSLLMGFAQSIALIPGTSRSGITTLAGIGLGLNKYTAFEYSLVLGLPVLVGSSMWTIYEDLVANGIPVLSDIGFFHYLNTAIILLVPFLVGCLSLIILKKIKRDKWLSVFGIYRIGLGTLILIFTYLL